MILLLAGHNLAEEVVLKVCTFPNGTRNRMSVLVATVFTYSYDSTCHFVQLLADSANNPETLQGLDQVT